ncbi:hypothetical protein SAMN04487983_10737 [Streptomyces sp. yr375]|nr:hypothetical protein SAMN04487983_10737 [Streptomyces sp. yr375]
MLLDGDEWRRTFDAYARDAWRFEAQPTYTMPNEAESLARFLRGDPKPADHNARWHERVRGFVASGRTIGRVRIVRQPLTDYQRYQFAWGIPGNIKAGEDIRILDVTDDDRGLPLSGTDCLGFLAGRLSQYPQCCTQLGTVHSACLAHQSANGSASARAVSR